MPQPLATDPRPPEALRHVCTPGTQQHPCQALFVAGPLPCPSAPGCLPSADPRLVPGTRPSQGQGAASRLLGLLAISTPPLALHIRVFRVQDHLQEAEHTGLGVWKWAPCTSTREGWRVRACSRGGGPEPVTQAPATEKHRTGPGNQPGVPTPPACKYQP